MSRHPPGADTPGSRHPPGADPPGSRHPRAQCILGDTGNKRVVRILLECKLVTVFFRKILSFCGATDIPILDLDQICYRFQTSVDQLTICIPFRYKVHSSDSPMARHPADLLGTRMTHPSHSWGFLLKNYNEVRYLNDIKIGTNVTIVTFNCFNFLFQIFRSIKFLTAVNRLQIENTV